MNVQCLQVFPNYAAASWYKDLAGLTEPEHFGDAVSVLEYGEYEFVGEIQEGSVCFGLRLLASATLAVDMENHAETIQEQKDGNCVSYVCCSLLWRRLCCYQV